MQSFSLNTLAAEQLTAAQGSSNGRSATTLKVDAEAGGVETAMRHTMVALVAGQALGEHESPGDATLQVLRGRVQLTAGGDTWDGTAGDLLVIPLERHDLQALDDSVVLLTVRR